jgi:hypothetical protein
MATKGRAQRKCAFAGCGRPAKLLGRVYWTDESGRSGANISATSATPTIAQRHGWRGGTSGSRRERPRRSRLDSGSLAASTPTST